MNIGKVILSVFCIACQKQILFSVGFQKSLTGPQNERPCNVKIPVSVSGQLKVEDAA